MDKENEVHMHNGTIYPLKKTVKDRRVVSPREEKCKLFSAQKAVDRCG